MSLGKFRSFFILLIPSLLALLIVILDVYVSGRINHNFYSQNSCDFSPSRTPTALIGLVAFIISLYGIVNLFKQDHKWLGLVAILIFLFVCIVAWLSFFVLSFVICL